MRNLLYLCLPFLLISCVSTSTIHTRPQDAKVFINGQNCGVSPCIYHDRYGFPDRMRVQIRSPGYESAEFFVDTQAPIASYALLGFGSYVFHTFSKEYRFSLKPLDDQASDETAQQWISNTELKGVELTSVLEQCLYWSEQQVVDIWDQRFFESAASLDCKLAESAIKSSRAPGSDPKPALARALIRYVEFRRSINLPSVDLPWPTEVLCNAAKVEYAKRAGASEVPPALPAFDLLCPEESRQLRNE